MASASVVIVSVKVQNIFVDGGFSPYISTDYRTTSKNRHKNRL